MTQHSSHNRGFSLVELMVGMVAGLIVSYAVIAFVLSSMKTNGEYVQSTKLTQGLRNTMDLVVRDLRRAGYDDLAISRLNGGATSAAVGLSPFAKICRADSGDNSCQTGGSAYDCIIYAYDRPSTASGSAAGKLDVNNGEVRGIRRVVVTPTGATASVGVIEYATSENSTKPACDGATAVYTSYPPSCNTTSKWCPLTDSATLNVRAFTITENSSTAIGSDPVAIRVRNFTVALTARRVGDINNTYLGGVDTSYKRGVQASIKVRTDCVQTTITNCNASP